MHNFSYYPSSTFCFLTLYFFLYVTHNFIRLPKQSSSHNVSRFNCFLLNILWRKKKKTHKKNCIPSSNCIFIPNLMYAKSLSYFLSILIFFIPEIDESMTLTCTQSMYTCLFSCWLRVLIHMHYVFIERD